MERWLRLPPLLPTLPTTRGLRRLGLLCSQNNVQARVRVHHCSDRRAAVRRRQPQSAAISFGQENHPQSAAIRRNQPQPAAVSHSPPQSATLSRRTGEHARLQCLSATPKPPNSNAQTTLQRHGFASGRDERMNGGSGTRGATRSPDATQPWGWCVVPSDSCPT